jgi:hypothetical protein
LILLTAPMRGEPVAVTSAMTAGMGDGEVSVGERLGAERRMRRRQSRKKNEHTPRLSAVTSPTDASSRADARARRWHQRGACEWDARVPLPNAIRPSPASRRGGPHPTLGGTLARWRSTRRFRRDPRGAAAGPRARWLVRERPLYAKRRHAPCPPKSGSHGRTCVVISRRDDVQRRGPWFVLTRDTGVPNYTSGSRRSWASQQRQSHFFDREVSSFGTSNRSSTNSLPKSEARRVGE